MKAKYNIEYASIQGAFWMCFCTIIGFCSTYLQAKGYSSTEIGIIMAVGNIMAMILQPVLADFADRFEKCNVLHILLAVLSIMLLSSLVGYLTSARGVVLSLCMTVLMAGINTALSMTNSLKFYMERSGHEINFGACRAIGSLAYSILSAVLGILVERVSVDSIMLGTLVISVLFLLLLIMVKVESRKFPAVERGHLTEDTGEEHTMMSFVKENPKLMMLLLGFALTYFTHSMITNFPNLVVQNVGGGSEAMGRVMAVMAISELPAMFLYGKLSRKFPCGSLLVFSLIVFTLKELAIYLAPTMGLLYVAFALQSLSFALYTPASVHYATIVAHPRDLVKAQTFFIVAMNVAVVFASVIGGIMMDQLGVKSSLFVGVLVSAVGSVIAFFFTDKKAGKIPPEEA